MTFNCAELKEIVQEKNKMLPAFYPALAYINNVAPPVHPIIIIYSVDELSNGSPPGVRLLSATT